MFRSRIAQLQLQLHPIGTFSYTILFSLSPSLETHKLNVQSAVYLGDAYKFPGIDFLISARLCTIYEIWHYCNETQHLFLFIRINYWQ